MHETSDGMHSFHLQKAGVRGGIVRIESTWEEIRGHSDHSPAINQLLGETLVASALFAGALKFEGRLSIHLRKAGDLVLLFAECTHDGYLRGIARCESDGDAQTVRLDDPRAQLAITIENARSGKRFQGLVAVEGGRLRNAFEGYFERSEQLPTRIVLAAGEGRCAGIMLQKLADGSDGEVGDDDAWNRVGHLLATLNDAELLHLPVDTLLLRLFQEEGVILQPSRALAFRCSCSRQRVLAMLQSLGPEEAAASLAEDGHVTITCEFCNLAYRVDRIDVASLFAGRPLAPTSDSPQ